MDVIIKLIINKTILKKLYLFIPLFLLLSTVSFSQKYLETISELSCECISKISDDVKPDEFNMKLGLCMIEASLPYQKQLKKNFKIDLEEINESVGEKLGKLIASKMISDCPDLLIIASQKINLSNEKKENLQGEITGKITKVSSDNQVVISLVDAKGKYMKFLWQTFIESNFNLMNNYKDLVDKNVSIEYVEKEFFDPKIREYRKYNVISKLQVVGINDLQCKDFINGMFFIPAKNKEEKLLKIERNGISQLEYYDKNQEILVYAIIEWIDDCSYKLIYDDTRAELDIDQKFINDNGGLIIEKEEIIGKCLSYKSTLIVNGNPMSMQGKICKE